MNGDNIDNSKKNVCKEDICIQYNCVSCFVFLLCVKIAQFRNLIYACFYVKTNKQNKMETVHAFSEADVAAQMAMAEAKNNEVTYIAHPKHTLRNVIKNVNNNSDTNLKLNSNHNISSKKQMQYLQSQDSSRPKNKLVSANSISADLLPPKNIKKSSSLNVLCVCVFVCLLALCVRLFLLFSFVLLPLAFVRHTVNTNKNVTPFFLLKQMKKLYSFCFLSSFLFFFLCLSCNARWTVKANKKRHKSKQTHTHIPHINMHAKNKNYETKKDPRADNEMTISKMHTFEESLLIQTDEEIDDELMDEDMHIKFTPEFKARLTYTQPANPIGITQQQQTQIQSKDDIFNYKKQNNNINYNNRDISYSNVTNITQETQESNVNIIYSNNSDKDIQTQIETQQQQQQTLNKNQNKMQISVENVENIDNNNNNINNNKNEKNDTKNTNIGDQTFKNLTNVMYIYCV